MPFLIPQANRYVDKYLIRSIGGAQQAFNSCYNPIGSGLATDEVKEEPSGSTAIDAYN